MRDTLQQSAQALWADSALSKQVRWLALEPYTFTSGRLYFRLQFPDGSNQYAYVIGRSRTYWLNHLLNRTEAVEVECLS